MQLHLHIKLNKLINLPINYNHILQGVIYNALSADYPDFAEMLHEEGGQFGKRRYKPFTFGPLKGKYSVKNKQIVFSEDIIWEIRSCDDGLIFILNEYFENNGIKLLSNELKNVNTAVTNTVIHDSRVRIKVLSPVVAYSTPEDDSHTYYYTPEEFGFYELTKQNALKRYVAIYGESADELNIRPVSIRQKDKVVTRYQGIIIEGWKGKYELEGDPKLINFLYQTGLGAKNAQGFGMFDAIKPFD